MAKQKQNEEKLSAFIIVYNEADLIKRALDSLKGVADEIMVFHDGPCSDDTLKIAKRYTKKVFILPRKKRAALHLIAAVKKAKYDWVLKLDADEFLSTKLRKNIKGLLKKKEVSAYTFNWPWWDGKKYITKKWPIKKVLFRKSKSSFLQFPGWDEPRTKGKTLHADYLLEHRPKKINSFYSWKAYRNKVLGRYAKTHAENIMKPFSSFETYQYDGKKDFPIQIKIRKAFPLLTAPIFGISAFFIMLIKQNVFREGKPVLVSSLLNIVYYLFLGYYIACLKMGISLDNVFPKAENKKK